MIYLLHNEELNKYKTIWERDYLDLVCMLSDPSKFKQTGLLSTRWDIIRDKDQIKEILDTKFTSKGRGENYDENLPSSTQIVDSLFPVNLKTQVFILAWLNNIDKEDFIEQEKHNRESLCLGLYLHKAIELWLLDKRPYYKRHILDIIEQLRVDKETLQKIPDFAEKQVKYETMIQKLLPKFFREQLYGYDVICCEGFLKNSQIQGTVDFIGIKDGQYSIIDWKTTRKTQKQSGNIKFSSHKDIDSYRRQLCLYDNLAIESGIIPKNHKNKIGHKIFQFHLLSEDLYKEFNFVNSEIMCWEDSINQVLGWYWSTRRSDEQ